MKHLWAPLTLRVSTICPLSLSWSQLGNFTYTCFQVTKSRHYKFQWFFLKIPLSARFLSKKMLKYLGIQEVMSLGCLNFHYTCERHRVNHYILIKYQYLRKITVLDTNKWILPLCLPRNTTVGKLGYSKIRYLAGSRSYEWSEWVSNSATLWTVTHQAPPSMGFSRQEYWSGLPFPSPGDLPDPGIKPRSPTLQADALTSETPGKPKVSY